MYCYIHGCAVHVSHYFIVGGFVLYITIVTAISRSMAKISVIQYIHLRRLDAVCDIKYSTYSTAAPDCTVQYLSGCCTVHSESLICSTI
jgi:hypothetical protein